MKSQEEEQKMDTLRGRSVLDSKGRLHGRSLIIMNAAIALGIIVIVLTIKAVMLDGPQKKTQPDKSSAKSMVEKTETPAQTTTPTPTAAPAQGADRWIRKDLDASKPMVALTFDDGPYSKVTRRILKTMQQNGGRATFFVVGNRVKSYQDTLALAYEQGNQIASHTYDHKDLSKMKAKKIKKEIDRANKQVSKVIGINTTALRPPYGNVSATMRKTIKTPMYYWSIDSEDWKSQNPDTIVRRCKKAEDGDIILMHDLYPTTADAVERLVPYLKKKGFQMVTIDELFYYKKITTKPGKVYYSGKK